MDFDDENLRNWDPGLLALPQNKSAEDVVSDFLTKLYEHTMDFLERKISKEVLDVTEINFWFSMPAVWSDRAQMATRSAAMKAGFGSRHGDKIAMIREPEAAAIACLNELIADGPSSLIKQGEGILICDCGGGTVDISSYEVIRPFPRLQLHETCVSIGGKCGSSTIDRAFHALLRQRFGVSFDRVSQRRKGIGSPLMHYFEGVKKDFGHGDSNEVFKFPLAMDVPNSEYYEREEEEDGIFRGEVILSYDDMVDLFKPVVDKIKALLKQQLGATEKLKSTTIKTIILAGGLGESRHLYKELKAWCVEGVTILNPPGSWEAICKGATLRGLEGPLVPKRICPRNYGICINKPFQTGLDLDSESFVCPFTNEKKARGYMEWIFQKGEDIFHDTTRSRSFYNITTEAADTRRFPIEFFVSNMALAPEKKSHPSVETFGQLVVDLSEVDLSMFRSRRLSRGSVLADILLPNVTAYAIDFEIRTKVIDETIGVMSFEAVVQGRPRGSVELQVMQESSNNNNVAFE